MKANELMLGDWVYWGEAHSNIDGDYYLEFYPRQIELADLFFLHVYEDNEELEFVKPIQLDEKNLKANGFIKKGRGFGIEIGNGAFNITDHCLMPIIYVHNLQHALKQCGLSELADNFKVEGE